MRVIQLVNFEIIKADYLRFCSCLHKKPSFRFLLRILRLPEYRTLLCYRLKGSWLLFLIKIIFKITSFYYPLFILCPKVGKGLFIQHGFSTIIACNSIGDNCWINQQVTIGHTQDGCPTIGNNCHFSSGCKVIGPIHIGDIVGIPAKIIKTRKDMDSEWVRF